jgi:hypothetical protein
MDEKRLAQTPQNSQKRWQPMGKRRRRRRKRTSKGNGTPAAGEVSEWEWKGRGREWMTNWRIYVGK